MQRAERLHGLARGGAEAADVERDQRPAVGDLAREDRHPLLLAELRVALLHPEHVEDLVERRAVDRGVLAHVEQREVKAEHLDLADDVAQRVLGDERGVLLAQRLLGHPQVHEQLGGPVIAVLPALARRAQARGHELEQPAVGLLRAAPARERGDVRKCCSRPSSRSRSGSGSPATRADSVIRLPSAADRRLVVSQAGVLHQRERRGGHLRRHVGVAVAVAADPGAEAQQRRHRHVGVRVRLADRRLEVAVDLGHDLGERRAEVDEPGADLVEHGRRHRAQLVGAPHLLHRGRDLAADLLLLAVPGTALVELAQQREDAPELADGRVAPGLGRMRGEDEPHLGGGERLVQLLGARAVGGELGDGGVQRAAARPGWASSVRMRRTRLRSSARFMS